MRIGFICDTFVPGGFGGGISRYCDVIGRALVTLGHEVHVFTLDLGGPIDDHSLPQGFVVHRIPRYRPNWVGWRTVYWHILYAILPGYLFNLSWGIPLGRYVLRLAREHELDVIEVPENGGYLAWYVRRLSREVPVCVRLHTPSIVTSMSLRAGEYRHLRQLNRMERSLVHNASAVSAPSAAVLALVRREFQLPVSPAEIIANPAVIPDLVHAGPAAIRSKRILFVGRLEQLKGIDVLIRAFSRVLDLHPDARLDLIGPDTLGVMAHGPLGLVRQYVSEGAESIVKAIQWHGVKTPADADRIRATAACVVVPSAYENFSYALVEAMALGCPVVASRTGGNPELIEHDRNGLLFRSGCDGELAQALVRVLNDPQWSVDLGAEARRTVCERFEAGRIGGRLADWYSAVAAKHAIQQAAPAQPVSC